MSKSVCSGPSRLVKTSIDFLNCARASLQRARAEGRDLAKLARRWIEQLPRDVWITFDADGLEQALCPGTGTPVPGGLSWGELLVWLDEAQLKQVQLQIATEVTNAAISVRNNSEAVQASQATRELAQRRLEAEQSKFDVGMSTNYFVVQAQRDLNDARNAELRAILNYRKALVEKAQRKAVPFAAIAFAYVFAIASRLAGPVCGGVALLVLFVHWRLVFEHGLGNSDSNDPARDLGAAKEPTKRGAISVFGLHDACFARRGWLYDRCTSEIAVILRARHEELLPV